MDVHSAIGARGRDQNIISSVDRMIDLGPGVRPSIADRYLGSTAKGGRKMSNKIILNLAMSIDGYIADPDGGYDWIQPSGSSSLNTPAAWSHKRFLEHISAVVMGKRCYDQQMHLDYADKQVYVATTQKRENHDAIHFIGGDLCREVAELRQRSDGDLYLFGGGKLIDPLLKGNLIDEYVLGIIPIILGSGIPLFLHGNPPIPLQLTQYYVEDGIVVLRYVPRK